MPDKPIAKPSFECLERVDWDGIRLLLRRYEDRKYREWLAEDAKRVARELAAAK